MSRPVVAGAVRVATRPAFLLAAGAVLVVAVLVAVIAVVVNARSTAGVTVTASSTATGTDAAAAWAADPDAATGDDAAALWRSDGETDGAWLKVSFPRTQELDRVRIDGAVSAGLRPASVLVVFDGASAVMVTADADGHVDVSFPGRSASEVSLRFVDAAEGATAIGVRGFRVDGSGGDVASPASAVWTSSAGPADAVDDGALADGAFGAEWSAGGGGWIQADWSAPQPVSALTVVGAAAMADLPAGGTLTFSDGSTVVVSGIGPGRATTVAFPPRMAAWARLDLEDGVTGVAEAGFALEGETPAVVPVATALPELQLASRACDDVAVPDDAAEDRLSLVCPETGSLVGDEQTLVVSAPPGTAATAVVVGTGGVSGVTAGRGQADASGRIAIPLTIGRLPDGPFGVRIEAAGLPPLHLSLVRPGETISAPGGSLTGGMTLQWQDEFGGPLSISRNGVDAQYTAIRPAADGNTQFSDAIFPDPALGLNTLATVDGALRIRAQPAGDLVDRKGWGRTNAGGILSSMRTDASGFAAQYGYFEARMLAPAGAGTWPAFWMLDTNSVVSAEDDFGEVDAVELYGHDLSMGCTAVHNWVRATGDDSDVECGEIVPDVSDLALEWHVYGARVLPGRVDFYVDGQFVRSSERLDKHTLPYYFMLNLALGGGWPIDLSPTGGVADLYVDWVRVYT